MAFNPSVIKTFIPSDFNPEKLKESFPKVGLGDQLVQASGEFDANDPNGYITSLPQDVLDENQKAIEKAKYDYARADDATKAEIRDVTGMTDAELSQPSKYEELLKTPNFNGSIQDSGGGVDATVSPETPSVQPPDKNLNKYDFNSYTYPSDLFSEDKRWGNMYVVFNINVQEDSKLAKDNPNLLIPDAEANKGKGAAITRNEISRGQFAATIAGVGVVGAAGAKVGLGALGLGGLNLTPGILTAGVLGGGVGLAASAFGGTATEASVENPGVIDFVSDTLAKNITRQTKRIKTAIALYCPPDISVKYGMQWADDDTSILSSALEISEDLGQAITGTTSNSNPSASNAIQNLILKLGTNATPSGTSALLGLAPNPRKEQLFNGVDFRTHQFNYKFIIRNQTDHTNVKNIIKEFKYHMHPEYKDGNDFIFLYPSEFDIQFYYKDGPSDELPKYTTCVLVDLNTNYTPQGVMNLLKGGKIAEINLNLVFRELSILTKEDIAEGY